jgi:DNA-directed RNA polymerase subunit RPC12/RpoP
VSLAAFQNPRVEWTPGLVFAPETKSDNKRIAVEMRIELNCAQCGRNSFGIDQDHPNHALVYCTDCGHEIGTMAELKERVAAEVMRRVRGRQAAA